MPTPRGFTLFIPELDLSSESTTRGIDLARGLHDRGATVRIVTLVRRDRTRGHRSVGRSIEHGVEVVRCPSQLDPLLFGRAFSPLFRDVFSNEERYVRVALNHAQLVPSVYVWRSLAPMNQRDLLIGVDLYAPLTLGVLSEFTSRTVAVALRGNSVDKVEPWALSSLRASPLVLFDGEAQATSFRAGSSDGFPEVSTERRTHEDRCIEVWDRLFSSRPIERVG